MAVPPAASISATTARPASLLRSTTPTLAPSAANSLDDAPPMPVAPPEISAILPASLSGMVRSSFFFSVIDRSANYRLNPDHTRNGLACYPAPIWPASAVLHQAMAAKTEVPSTHGFD